jgi:glycine reductase
MASIIKIVHYLNQFFGGIGREESADIGVQIQAGPVGPGRLLQQTIGGRGEVVGTIICGDNQAAEDWDAVSSRVGQALTEFQPDVVIAGPAFDSGRYGIACARVCIAAKALGIPSVTGMHPDNAGVITHRKEIMAIPTGTSVADMPAIFKNMVTLAEKLISGTELGPAGSEGYIPHGIRLPVTHEKKGYERAVDMVLARIEGRPFVSEVMQSWYENINPAPPIADLSEATIGLVACTGMVPKDNPDRLVSGHATQAFRYSLENVSELRVGAWESAHGGFNTTTLNTVDPNYGLPVRTLRKFEGQGVIKGIHPFFFSTVGNQTAVSAGVDIGARIAKEFDEAGVNGVLMVSG